PRRFRPARSSGSTTGTDTRLRMRVPAVVHRGFGFNLVVFENHLSGRLLNADADGLFARFCGPRIPDDVIAEDEVSRLATHADACRVGLVPVVLNEVFFQPIAVAGHPQRFVPEEDAVFVIPAHFVLLKQIVRVLVSDGNAEAPVVLEDVFLEQPVPDAPAKEESVLAVAPGDAFPDHGPLRTASRMEPKPRVVLAHATLHEHVVGLLEADAVAGIA